MTRHKLLVYAGILLAIAISKGIFQFLTRWIVIGVSRDIEFDLRNDLFARLESLSLFLLPAQPHRRHYGAGHQRPERGPHAARSGGHVFGQHDRLHRRRAGLHDLHQPVAHAVHLSAAAGRERRDPDFRPPHSRALRTNPGDVLRHLRARPGELFRSAPDTRLRAGRSRDRRLRTRKPGIHPPQPQTGAPHGNALAHARTDAGLRCRIGALARRPRSHHGLPRVRVSRRSFPIPESRPRCRSPAP